MDMIVEIVNHPTEVVSLPIIKTKTLHRESIF
jgi:hypothetical protein